MTTYQRNQRPKFQRKKLNKQDNDDMCLYGRTSHVYGHWQEVYREGKLIVCKVCRLCTHLFYKDDFVAMLDAKKSEAYDIKNQHIDLFKP